MNLKKIDGRQPFFINNSAPKTEPNLQPWRGPDQYLEEAIRTHCSDLTLTFLQTQTGVEFVTAMELHHRQHGYDVAWNECPKADCNGYGLRWFEIAVRATADIEREMAAAE